MLSINDIGKIIFKWELFIYGSDYINTRKSKSIYTNKTCCFF